MKAKIEGRKIVKPPQPERGKVIDLMQALRESAGMGGSEKASPKAKSKAKAGASKGKKTAATPRRSHKKAS